MSRQPSVHAWMRILPAFANAAMLFRNRKIAWRSWEMWNFASRYCVSAVPAVTAAAAVVVTVAARDRQRELSNPSREDRPRSILAQSYGRFTRSQCNLGPLFEHLDGITEAELTRASE